MCEMAYRFGCARNEFGAIKMVAYLIHVEFTAAKHKFTTHLPSLCTQFRICYSWRGRDDIDSKTPTDTNETPTHSDHLTVAMKLHLTRTRIDFLISLINGNGNPWLGPLCIGPIEPDFKIYFMRTLLPPPQLQFNRRIRQPNDFQST